MKCRVKRVISSIVLATSLVFSMPTVCGVSKGVQTVEAASKAFKNYKKAVTNYNKKVVVYNESVKKLNEAATAVNNANEPLEILIEDAQGIINAGEKPYDESTITDLSNALATVKGQMTSVPEKKKSIKKIKVTSSDKKLTDAKLNGKTKALKKKTTKLVSDTKKLLETAEKLVVSDYTEQTALVTEKKTNLENSIKIQKQITAPAESFVLERLREISDIVQMAPVTEDHDPNGKLNKTGGYTSTVYFSVKQVDQSKVYGDNLIDKGTDAGGAIETYANVEDAEKRNTYLSTFDGATAFNPGSHIVLGTMVIRTSDELTASQQKALEKQIIEKFIELK